MIVSDNCNILYNVEGLRNVDYTICECSNAVNVLRKKTDSLDMVDSYDREINMVDR